MWVTEAGLWLRGRAAITLFLTLVPVLVYLLSGMWSYVSPNLSESTVHVPLLPGLQGNTHAHRSAVTHRQTVYPNCARVEKHNLVYTLQNFTTHTAHTRIRVLLPPRAHCTHTHAFTSNNWAFIVTQQQ